MSPELLKKTLRDTKSSTIGRTVVLIAIVALQLSVFPTMKDFAADFERLFASYPEAFKSLFKTDSGFATGIGYLEAEVFSVTPLMLIGMSSARPRPPPKSSAEPWTCCWPTRSAASTWCSARRSRY